jgi:hypothetical protein
LGLVRHTSLSFSLSTTYAFMRIIIFAHSTCTEQGPYQTQKVPERDGHINITTLCLQNFFHKKTTPISGCTNQPPVKSSREVESTTTPTISLSHHHANSRMKRPADHRVEEQQMFHWSLSQQSSFYFKGGGGIYLRSIYLTSWLCI